MQADEAEDEDEDEDQDGDEDEEEEEWLEAESEGKPQAPPDRGGIVLDDVCNWYGLCYSFKYRLILSRFYD